MVFGDDNVSSMTDRHAYELASGILKMAQMAHAYNAQLVKLAKVIPPMIQQAIKKAMKLVVDKLGSLCARVN
ncbi:hypothetical protein HAX54_029509, partial [Datura stramonium]|nr:hypothetical protein [Datura stramonium]